MVLLNVAVKWDTRLTLQILRCVWILMSVILIRVTCPVPILSVVIRALVIVVTNGMSSAKCVNTLMSVPMGTGVTLWLRVITNLELMYACAQLGIC